MCSCLCSCVSIYRGSGFIDAVQHLVRVKHMVMPRQKIKGRRPSRAVPQVKNASVLRKRGRESQCTHIHRVLNLSGQIERKMHQKNRDFPTPQRVQLLSPPSMHSLQDKDMHKSIFEHTHPPAHGRWLASASSRIPTTCCCARLLEPKHRLAPPLRPEVVVVLTLLLHSVHGSDSTRHHQGRVWRQRGSSQAIQTLLMISAAPPEHRH